MDVRVKIGPSAGHREIDSFLGLKIISPRHTDKRPHLVLVHILRPMSQPSLDGRGGSDTVSLKADIGVCQVGADLIAIYLAERNYESTALLYVVSYLTF